MSLMEAMPRTTLRRELRWVVASRCPRGWRALVERCGGSLFHSPAGLMAAAPPGTPLFAELYQGDEAAGLAAGVASRCRFGLKPRHFYFPTVPAVVEPSQGEAALAALVEQLRARGAVDIQFDSYDGSWRRWWAGPTGGHSISSAAPRRRGTRATRHSGCIGASCARLPTWGLPTTTWAAPPRRR